MDLRIPGCVRDDCPDVARLAAYQNGRLTEVDLESVASHIDTCPLCISALEQLEVQQPPDQFVAKVRSYLVAPNIESGEGYERFRRAVREVHSPSPSADNTATRTIVDRDPKLPEAIGPYRIVSRLGVGGMGVVYKARQSPVNRLVALKMILGGVFATKSTVARFRIEGEAIARMQHIGIVQIYEFGDHDHLPYFSMELVDGGSLRDLIAGAPIPVDDVARLIRSLAEALAYAHERNVLHRDLKPGNILLTEEGQPKITDFGLAKLLDSDLEQTVTEAVLGTPSYMAPEQATAGMVRELTPAVDIWSLGVILYESLTKFTPFRGKDRHETLARVRDFHPAPPSSTRREVPRDLDAICLKCLEKAPGRRYASARELADDLQRFLNGEPTTARPPSPIRRTGRFVRRHAAAVLATLMLCVTLGTALAARYLSDPERPLREIEAELKTGAPVILIGENDEPRWSQVLTGPKGVTTSRGKDGSFSLHSWDFSLIALAKSIPSESYTFSAEIRHEKSSNAGRVGLFCMHSAIWSEPAPVHQFVEFDFNDLHSIADIVEGRFPLEKLKDAHLNRPRVTIHTFNDGRPSLGSAHGLVSGPLFKPYGNHSTPAPWRRMSLKISPRGLRAFWENAELAPIDSSKLQEAVGQFVESRRTRQPLAVSISEIRPNGGLGLFVHNGSAAFRNVRIEFDQDPQ